MRKMSWMMDWKWMKYEYSEEAVGDVWGVCGRCVEEAVGDVWKRLWEICGGGCGRCVEEAVGDVWRRLWEMCVGDV